MPLREVLLFLVIEVGNLAHSAHLAVELVAGSTINNGTQNCEFGQLGNPIFWLVIGNFECAR